LTVHAILALPRQASGENGKAEAGTRTVHLTARSFLTEALCGEAVGCTVSRRLQSSARSVTPSRLQPALLLALRSGRVRLPAGGGRALRVRLGAAAERDPRRAVAPPGAVLLREHVGRVRDGLV
jgi:hypothetical protein